MNNVKKVMLGIAMLSVASVVKAETVEVCSGSTVGGGSAMNLCSLSLLASSEYRVDLLVVPASGSSGANAWCLNVVDFTSNTTLGSVSDVWFGGATNVLSVTFSTLSDASSTSALVMGWSQLSPANYSLSVTAVPEAPVYLMMIGGMAMVGMAIRRKKNRALKAATAA